MEHLRNGLRRLLRSPMLVPSSQVALAATVFSAGSASHASPLGGVATYLDLGPCGVSNISFATYAANEPIEDRFVVRVHNEKLIACVVDGHGGWQAAEYVHRELPGVFVKELMHTADEDDPEQVASAMSRAFTRTDRGFLSAVRGAFELGFGDVARVGCCTLAAVLAPGYLIVANAGDCRAVLGQVVPADAPSVKELDTAVQAGGSETSSGAETAAGTLVRFHGTDGSLQSQWARLWAVPLSDDHNARMPREVARLRSAHPGEADIVMCKSPDACYVKGRLQPTRALGDAYLKHSEFNGPSPRGDAPGSGYPASTVGSGTRLFGHSTTEVAGSGFDGSGRLLVDDDAAAAEATALGASNKHWGRHIPPSYTPPYITSTPEVQVVRLQKKGAAAGEAGMRYFSPSGSAAPQPPPSSPGAAADFAYPGSGPSPTAAAEALAAVPAAALRAPGSRAQRFVVLGCDGVWDVLSNEEAVRFVAEDAGARETVASRLVQHVISREAEQAGLDVEQLMALPPGKRRRSLHDDITAIVVFIDGSSMARPGGSSSAIGSGQKKGWWPW